MPGSKPGERRGGRKKNTPNRGVDITNPAVAELVAQEMRMRKADPNLKQGIEILAQGSNLMFGIVARCSQQPKDPKTGLPAEEAVREAMLHAFDRAMSAAARAAHHQTPTFKAVHLAMEPPSLAPGDTAKVINLKIFENTGTALALTEVSEDDEA